jgi:hypothetical protein
MSTAPSSEVEGLVKAAKKSYKRHSTSDGTSSSMALATIAEVCSYQLGWQTKEEQIKGASRESRRSPIATMAMRGCYA